MKKNVYIAPDCKVIELQSSMAVFAGSIEIEDPWAEIEQEEPW